MLKAIRQIILILMLPGLLWPAIPCEAGVFSRYFGWVLAVKNLPQAVIAAPRQVVSLLTFKDLNGSIELGTEYEDENETGFRLEQGKKIKIYDRGERKKRFEERLNLDGMFHIYDPDLLNVDFDTSLGVAQRKYTGDYKDNDDENLDEYSLYASFLQARSFNFALFTNRNTVEIDRDFGQNVDSEGSSYGGLFNYSNSWVKARLYLKSNETDEDYENFRRQRDDDFIEFKASSLDQEVLRTSFRYTHRKNDNTFTTFNQSRSSSKLTHDDFVLNNYLNYKNLNGTSFIAYYRSSGTYDFDHIQVIENLIVEHTKNFRTVYAYNFNHFDAGSLTSKTHYGKIGFTHKLYRSLETQAYLEAQYRDDDTQKELYYNTRLSMAYNKQVPGGLFTARYRFMYRRTDRDLQSAHTGEQIQTVFGEPIVLYRARPSVLQHSNIVPGSVVVRNAQGSMLLPDIDYRLSSFGNTVEIRSLQLDDNSNVLIDYEYRESRDLQYNTLDYTLDLRYDFRRLLAFYFRSYRRDYSITSGSLDEGSTNELADERDYSYGTQLTWRWLTLQAEWTRDTSDLIPFDRFFLHGSLKMKPTANSSMSLSGSHYNTDYKSDRGTVTYDSLSAQYRVYLLRRVEAVLRAEYLQDDGIDRDETIWKYTADIKAWIRQVELNLSFDYLDREDRDRQERDELEVEFKIIRYFDIL